MAALKLSDKTQKYLDEMYSGKYIISALRHSINPATHMCYLELAKESTDKAYPSAVNSNPALSKIKTL
jgi:hypothetical protein